MTSMKNLKNDYDIFNLNAMQHKIHYRTLRAWMDYRLRNRLRNSLKFRVGISGRIEENGIEKN